MFSWNTKQQIIIWCLYETHLASQIGVFQKHQIAKHHQVFLWNTSSAPDWWFPETSVTNVFQWSTNIICLKLLRFWKTHFKHFYLMFIQSTKTWMCFFETENNLYMHIMLHRQPANNMYRATLKQNNCLRNLNLAN